MKAIISNFRRSIKHCSGNQMIVLVEGVDSMAKAEKLVGKKVVWGAPGKDKKKIAGTITAAHGNSGAVRAHFERGMPGQAIGTEIDVE